MSDSQDFNLSCPMPITERDTVVLAHGGGGTLMNQLIEKIFVSRFSNDALNARHDSSVLPVGNQRIAFTTDSYVVRPLFFPGGDIGSMAIHGTVNDLAMSGARPLYISSAYIMEEGLPMETLRRIVDSMTEAANKCGVQIVTGDTKVVDKGKGDLVFINTAGIGIVEHSLDIVPRSVRPGDAIIVSGDLGRHGIAIMAVREGLEFETTIESDSAPVSHVVMDMLAEGITIHCLRDLTRGGLASALNEIAQASEFGISVQETAVPVREDVQGACEILGFDPLYVANEGRFVAFVPAEEAERALAVMKRHDVSSESAIIGKVTDERTTIVSMTSRIGAARILDMLSGEQLPRIC